MKNVGTFITDHSKFGLDQIRKEVDYFILNEVIVKVKWQWDFPLARFQTELIQQIENDR